MDTSMYDARCLFVPPDPTPSPMWYLLLPKVCWSRVFEDDNLDDTCLDRGQS